MESRQLRDWIPSEAQRDLTETSPAPRSHWLRELFIVVVFYYSYELIRRFAHLGNVQPRAFRNQLYVIDLERNLHIYTESAVQRAFLGATMVHQGHERVLRHAALHHHGRSVAVGLPAPARALPPVPQPARHDDGAGLDRLLRLPAGATADGGLPPGGPHCFVDTLDKIGGLWSYHSSAAKAIANPFAAMPSLHFGWALWCGTLLWSFARHPLVRALSVIYPILTLLAIVVTANHYWLDAAGGAVIFLTASQVLRMAAPAGRHERRSRPSSRSAAWRRAESPACSPLSIRAISSMRSSPSTLRGRGRRGVVTVRARHGLRHHDLGVGERSNLRQMGDDTSPGGVARAGRATSATAVAAVPPIPASTSSKTSVSGASVNTRRRASIVRASSPPLATRDSGSNGKPGLAAIRKVTSSPGASLPTVISISACGIANDRTTLAHRRRQPRRAGTTHRGDRLRRLALGGHRDDPLLFQRGDTLVVALELGETVLRLVLKADDIGQRVAVLSTQVAQAAGAVHGSRRAAVDPRRGSR